MKSKFLSILYFIFVFSFSLSAQSIFIPDLKTTIDGTGWKGKFTAAELAKRDSSDAIMITKTDADEIIWLENFSFTNGTIEFDAKGKSGPPQSSFVGVSFRVVDKNTYDAVYFRPFNFCSPNPVNKAHAVQYTSHPDWTWKRLRDEHTGEYEKGIDPAPNGDEWFHAKIVVHKPDIKVFINGASDPSLVVNELSDRKDGSVGLWCNGFGIIANLKIEQLFEK
jgi:hypothetical protein